jgi:hypothetical protein
LRKRKMQILKSKTMAILIALFMMISMSASIILQPTVSAHTPIWQIPTFAYISPAPNPVGVGQTAGVFMWLTNLMPGATEQNSIRYHNYNLTIIKPDGTTETHIFNVVTDPTSSQAYTFAPDQVGNYTIVFSYPGETYTYTAAQGGTTTYDNDTYMPSSATATLTVQQEQIPYPVNSYPLPTAYWTRPIEGQNTYWYTIASNWLGASSPQIGQSRWQKDGTAPNSAHIMWTKPLQDGGVVGGNTTVPGDMYYQGLDYNYRFNNPIIMHGRLYYELPLGNSAGGGGIMCVDLRSGQQIWYRNDIPAPTFGYLYEYSMYNQYGVIPDGFLFTDNFARAFDPNTGNLMFNVTGVPTGTAAYGPSGEILRYQINAANHWLAQWNSSKVLISAGGTYPPVVTSATPLDASPASSYDWNTTVPWLMPGATIIAAYANDILLGRNGTLPTVGSWTPTTFWAMSLKSESLGRLLWMTNIAAPLSNQTLYVGPVDANTRVFTILYKETMVWSGYSLDNGNQLWGPTAPEEPFAYYNYQLSATGQPKIAYGKLYVTGWDGICYAYDDKTGALQWTYGNGGEGNSTFAGFTEGGGAYGGHFPIFINAIADGKIYLYSSEHSPNTPLYKNNLIRCINAYNGSEIWTIFGYGGSQAAAPPGLMETAIADGFYVYYNAYDSQLYCIGKGPSATTVTAPDNANPLGTSVVIKGTVIDISAGTKQNEQAGDFPNGVPAVSDASQSAWMEYVYMQKPMPTNATGVPVSIDVIDSNGNHRNIGTTMSDSSGTFSLQWAPDITGKYTVIATFAGSESYWPSSAETSFAVDPAAPTASPYPTVNLPPTEMYIVGTGIAIIIAVAIVGVILAMMLRKRP